MIYLIVLIILLLGVILEKQLDDSGKRNMYIFESVLLILFMGLRYKIGGDSIRYEWFYQYVPSLTDLLSVDSWAENSYQPFWLICEALCRSFSTDFFVFQFFHSLFVNGVIFFIAYRKCQRPLVFILLYYLTCYLYFSTEILRESFAVVLFMLSVDFMIKRKYLVYFLCCFIAFGFHSSAMVLFFLPLIYEFTLDTNLSLNVLKILVIALIVSFGLSFFLDNFLLMFYTENLFMQTKIESVQESGSLNIFGLLRSIFAAIPFFIVYYDIFTTKQPGDTKAELKRNRFIVVLCVIFFLVGQICLPLVRLQNYCSVLFLILFVNRFWANNGKGIKILYWISMVVLLVNNFSYHMSDVQSLHSTKQKHYQMYIPYHSVFTKEEDISRTEFFLKQF